MRLGFVVCLAVSSVATAADLSARAEAGVGLALSEPQRNYFSPGGTGFLMLDVELLSWLDAEVGVGGLVLPAVTGAPVSGAASALLAGAGLRLRRPWLGAQVVPWLDASFDYALTGGLSRVGLTVGLGVLFRISPSSPVAFGPAFRYLEVFKLTDPQGFLNVDAAILSLGLSVELLIGTRPELDTDGDGFADERDSCPAVAGIAPDGCPPRDNDEDGIPDDVDKCPIVKGLAAFNGCPDPDRDRDGIPNDLDNCPDKAEDKDGFEDKDGCPDPDNDKDGILDVEDACPNQWGPRATQGCPDTDSDGVPDSVDACPNKPGTIENGGCPIYKQVVVTETRIQLLQKIFFAFGKANILTKSFGLLDEVVAALKDHPKICVRIEGHTDSVGSAKRNLVLSEDRTISVMKYLSEQGVDPTRMSAQGYGQTQPLETNKTAEGRERNRRVEFVILSCDKLSH